MKRLRKIKDYLISEGGFKSLNISCHTGVGEIVPVEQHTETGVYLFVDKYQATMFIEDVSEKELNYIKLLMYEWFRLNKQDEEESFRISSDEIDDLASLVTIDMTLVEITHLIFDPDGKIEREGNFYSIGEEPVPVGI
ncbi:phage tail protein [bacterium]|nr:phage tail protein [bacterium]